MNKSYLIIAVAALVAVYTFHLWLFLPSPLTPDVKQTTI